MCTAFDPLTFQCDLTQNNCLTQYIPNDCVDLCTLVFVLSAIPLDKQALVVQNLCRVIKAGGNVIVRDYALYDSAMLRFGRDSKVDERLYARQDGTLAYYFDSDALTSLFEAHNFTTYACDYVIRRTVNKKEGVDVQRQFIQARFVKK